MTVEAIRPARAGAVPFKRLAVSPTVLFGALAQPVLAEPGAWQVTDDTSPLTNLPAVSAVLPSNNDLTNMIGAAERASRVLRCSDRTLVVYVNWPEVVNYDSTNFIG